MLTYRKSLARNLSNESVIICFFAISARNIWTAPLIMDK